MPIITSLVEYRFLLQEHATADRHHASFESKTVRDRLCVFLDFVHANFHESGAMETLYHKNNLNLDGAFIDILKRTYQLVMQSTAPTLRGLPTSPTANSSIGGCGSAHWSSIMGMRLAMTSRRPMSPLIDR